MPHQVPDDVAAEAIRQMATYIISQDDHVADGLTSKKVKDRGEVVYSDDHQVQIVVERHRGILGEEYIPGEPMGSMMTYYVRYTLDTDADELTDEELGAKDGYPPSFQIGYWSIADRHASDYYVGFEPDSEGDRVVMSESFTGEQRHVDSLEEALAFADELTELDYSFIFLSEDYLTEEEIEHHASRIAELVQAEVREEVERRWKEEVGA